MTKKAKGAPKNTLAFWFEASAAVRSRAEYKEVIQGTIGGRAVEILWIRIDSWSSRV